MTNIDKDLDAILIEMQQLNDTFNALNNEKRTSNQDADILESQIIEVELQIVNETKKYNDFHFTQY